MKRMLSTRANRTLFKSTLVFTLALVSTQSAFAHHPKHHKLGCLHRPHFKEAVATMPMAVPDDHRHWYIGGNIGVSRTHDLPATGSGNSVDQTGPGTSVVGGYQFLSLPHFLMAGELGFTQYHDSSEDTIGTNVANTEHYAIHAAAVGQLPLKYHFNALAKLGVAYSYAKKVFVASGASGRETTYSPYYGFGLAYNVTSYAVLVAQWARAQGNNRTGSTDLYSIGFTYALG